MTHEQQIKAVIDAIRSVIVPVEGGDGYPLGMALDDLGDNVSNVSIDAAQAAIAASNSQYVPMLVEALKAIAKSEECHEEWYRTIAKETLNNLPEELRG